MVDTSGVGHVDWGQINNPRCKCSSGPGHGIYWGEGVMEGSPGTPPARGEGRLTITGRLGLLPTRKGRQQLLPGLQEHSPEGRSGCELSALMQHDKRMGRGHRESCPDNKNAGDRTWGVLQLWGHTCKL